MTSAAMPEGLGEHAGPDRPVDLAVGQAVEDDAGEDRDAASHLQQRAGELLAERAVRPRRRVELRDDAGRHPLRAHLHGGDAVEVLERLGVHVGTRVTPGVGDVLGEAHE